MNNYTIEPVQTKSELEALKITNIALADFTFLIKTESTVIGYSQLVSISKPGACKALWLNKLICGQKNATKILLKEVAMHSWELGFDAIFSEYSLTELKDVGFIEFESERFDLDITPNSIMAMELSWDGLKKFEKIN